MLVRKLRQDCTHYIEFNLVHFFQAVSIFMLHLSFSLSLGDIWRTALQTEQLDFNFQGNRRRGGENNSRALSKILEVLSWSFQGWYSWHAGKDEGSLNVLQITVFCETSLVTNKSYKEWSIEEITRNYVPQSFNYQCSRDSPTHIFILLQRNAGFMQF